MEQLRETITRHSHELLTALRLYARRAGLADSDAAARELLGELTVEALRHADRFDPSRHTMSWLLGIAANLVKRRISDQVKRERREPLIRDLLAAHEGEFSDGELFDWLAERASLGTSSLLSDETDTLLENLSSEDQRIIRLAILNDLSGDLLARELGISPGAARMRLHRALQRLRTQYFAKDETS